MDKTTSNETRPGQREYQGALTQMAGLLAEMAERVKALQAEAAQGRQDGALLNWGHTGSAKAAFEALEQSAGWLGVREIE